MRISIAYRSGELSPVRKGGVIFLCGKPTPHPANQSDNYVSGYYDFILSFFN